MIACLGETTGIDTLENLLKIMRSSDEGLLILKDLPRINSKTIDLEALAKLPPNTFGYAYKKFLNDNVNLNNSDFIFNLLFVVLLNVYDVDS